MIEELLSTYTAHCNKQHSQPPVLSPLSELLFILLHLHHYPVTLFLAIIFSISATTASNLQHHMLTFLYVHLSPHLHLHTHAFWWQRGAQMYRRTITWLMDGMEQPVHVSQNPVINTDLYSVKKKQHSLMLLIIVAIGRTILWLSPSYSGSMTDLEIAQETKVEWNQFDPDEMGLGDTGFQGQSPPSLHLPHSSCWPWYLQCRVGHR